MSEEIDIANEEIIEELTRKNEELKRCYKELLDDYMKVARTDNSVHFRQFWENTIKYY